MVKALLNKDHLRTHNMKALLRIDRDPLPQNSRKYSLTKALHNRSQDHTDFMSHLEYGQLKTHSSSSREAI
jgi:hypothetical protein